MARALARSPWARPSPASSRGSAAAFLAPRCMPHHPALSLRSGHGCRLAPVRLVHAARRPPSGPPPAAEPSRQQGEPPDPRVPAAGSNGRSSVRATRRHCGPLTFLLQDVLATCGRRRRAFSSNAAPRRRDREVMDMAGETVVVTGVGHGIGKATAELFADQDVNLVLADLNEDWLATTAETCGARGPRPGRAFRPAIAPERRPPVRPGRRGFRDDRRPGQHRGDLPRRPRDGHVRRVVGRGHPHQLDRCLLLLPCGPLPHAGRRCRQHRQRRLDLGCRAPRRHVGLRRQQGGDRGVQPGPGPRSGADRPGQRGLPRTHPDVADRRPGRRGGSTR